MSPLAKVLDDVSNERSRQDAKWGEQNHDIFLWLSIMGEEVGECHNAALEATFHDGSWEHLREELVQTAAVTVAIIEFFDRSKLKK